MCWFELLARWPAFRLPKRVVLLDPRVVGGWRLICRVIFCSCVFAWFIVLSPTYDVCRADMWSCGDVARFAVSTGQVHAGAKLKGGFSRMDYMARNHADSPNASFRKLDAMLPMGAR